FHPRLAPYSCECLLLRPAFAYFCSSLPSTTSPCPLRLHDALTICTFIRGSDESPDEQPTMSVILNSFAIDKTPVTNKQFRVFVEAGGYENPSFWLPHGWNYITSNNIKHPNYW